VFILTNKVSFSLATGHYDCLLSRKISQSLQPIVGLSPRRLQNATEVGLAQTLLTSNSPMTGSAYTYYCPKLHLAF